MKIGKAVKEAIAKDGVIRRKSKVNGFLTIRSVIKPTSSHNTCLLILIDNGKIKRGSAWWNPTADDLMADDWEVLPISELMENPISFDSN